MKAYKFFDASALQYVEKGSVRIGTAAGFRARGGKSEIGRSDPTELRHIWDLKNQTEIGLDHPFLRPFLENSIARLGPIPKESREIKFATSPQTTFVLEVDCRLLCLSSEINDLILEKMWKELENDYYYEISDVYAYLNEISSMDIGLGRYELKSVDYTKNITSEMYDDDPFKKLPRFAWQKELRVIFYQENDRVASPIDVIAPGILHYIDIVRNPFATSAK
jgi:hypothetical protein